MICIISDSHDNTRAVSEVCDQLKLLGPDTVIHCGDLTSPSILEFFSDFNFYFVYGNCDWDTDSLTQKALELGLHTPDSSLEIELEGKSILVTHGDNALLLEHAVSAQSFDYIFHGHTHLMSDQREGKTRVINPGALSRAEPLSFACLNLGTDMLEVMEL